MGSDRKSHDEAVTAGRELGLAPRRTGASESATRTVVASELLGPGGLLRIDLDGEVYTLRLTRNHRLILTK